MSSIISDIIAWAPSLEELKPHLSVLLPASVVFSYISFVLLRWLYRVSPLHPLYRFPRPTAWAAATEWYEFYWNAIHDGQMIFKIEEWHKQYGPIVRVGPNELHIADPDFYGVMLAVGYKFPKRHAHYKAANFGDEASVALPDVAEHRRRRQVLSPLFSKAAINRMDHRIREYVDQAVDCVEKRIDNPGGIQLGKIIRCMNLDIITEIVYANSAGTLASGDVDNGLISGLQNALGYFWWFNFLYPVNTVMDALPFGLVKKMVPPDFIGIIDMARKCESDVKEFLKDPEAASSRTSHKTVFEALILDGPKTVKGYKVPRLSALVKEAQGTVGAGIGTTASVLTIGTYRAIRNPVIQKSLFQELVQAFPDGEGMTAMACEKLPYLFYVSMSSYIMHSDPSVFPKPREFKPERWLHDDKDGAMERQWVPFIRGSRSCLGVNLAMAELYITFAAMFRNFEFDLHPDNTVNGEMVDNMVSNWKGELVVIAKRR